jgi:hypothetical protein
MALGFGVAVFACFLIPLGAVLLMPAAVAGGTLLSRRVLGLPIEGKVPGPPAEGRVSGASIEGKVPGPPIEG